MDDKQIQLLIVVLGLLSSAIFYFIGQRSERRKQVMIIKANLLIPIEEWLSGAERMSGMLCDTLNSVNNGLPLPTLYNFEERRVANQKMSEGTTKILGILLSKELSTFWNRKQIMRLTDNISRISQTLQRELLPLENAVLESGQKENPPKEIILQVTEVKNKLDILLFASHTIITKLKTHYT